ncbi:MAG: hypothetical protein J6Q94_07320 [Clostridia bacterium]|nr:hypothetical protein [Clostridia bacterium]
MDIGIIGGADGPTSVFVSTSSDLWIYAAIAAVVVIVAVVLIIKKRRKK